MSYDIRVQPVSARLLAAVPAQLPHTDGWAEAARLISAQAWQWLSEHPQVHATGLNVWLYDLDTAPPGQIAVVPGAEVAETFDPDGPVQCIATPAGTAAFTVHVGEYAALPAAHQAVVDHCAAHGLDAAGPSWEVYGRWNPDPAQQTTTVYHLLT